VVCILKLNEPSYYLVWKNNIEQKEFFKQKKSLFSTYCPEVVRTIITEAAL